MRRDVIERAGRAGIALILATMLALAPEASSETPGPRWLPGFPVRAGASVILMWTPVPGATAYRLARKMEDKEIREIYNGPATMFNDAGIPVDATVTYHVTAVVAGRDTPPSTPATLKRSVPISRPKFTGAIASSQSISLRWTNPPEAMYSNIYRSEGERGPYALLASIQQNTYSDRNVKKGVNYHYRVTAVDGSGRESDRSESVSAMLAERVEAVTETAVFRKVYPAGEFHGEEFRPLNQPSEIEATADGDLHVLERRSIQFFDRDGVFLRRIDFPGGWGLASGAVTDRDGGILLAFHGDHVVRKIEPDGKVAAEIRYPPFREKIPINPNHVAVDPDGHYWILDGVSASIVKTDRLGVPVAVIGRRPESYELRNVLETELPAAKKIYLNPHDGRLYVLLGVSAEIRVFDPKTLSAVKTFGGLGAANARFQAVGGLAFRKNGNILVLDPLLQVIKEFDKEYEYVATYVNPAEKDKPKLSANLATAFAFREDIGRVYVTSTLGHRVYKFDIPD